MLLWKISSQLCSEEDIFFEHPEQQKSQKKNIIYGIEFHVNSGFSVSNQQHRMKNEEILLIASSDIFSRIKYDITSPERKETNKKPHIKLQSRYLCFWVFI